MDETSQLNRHNNVHRQMAAFSELLHRVRTRYANSQLRHMLYAVCIGVTVLPRRPVPVILREKRSVVANDVTSLRQLHHLVDELKRDKRRRGIAKQDERHIVRYFEKFFADIKYLTTLKRYFEERIYACLYQYYYQPGVDDQITSIDNGNNGRPLATVSDDGSDRQVWIIPEGTTVSDIVRQLWTLSRDWDTIIVGADLHVDDDFGYGPDPDAEPYENILRLIPRWVQTGFKALQLAKVWWTEANKLYNRSAESDASIDAIATSTTLASIRRKTTQTEGELSAIDNKINHLEITIELAEEELRQRMREEGRLEALWKKLKAAEEADATARQTYDKLLREKERLSLDYEEDDDSSNSSDTRLEHINRQLHVAFQTLEVTSYQANLIRDDIEFENNFRSPRDQYSMPPQMDEDQLELLKNELVKDKERRTVCQQRLERLHNFQSNAVSQKTSTMSDSYVTNKARRASRRYMLAQGYRSDTAADEYSDRGESTLLDRRAMVGLPSLTRVDQARSKASSTQSLHRTHLPRLVKRL